MRDEQSSDPADKADFQANATKYLASLDERILSWVNRKGPSPAINAGELRTSHDAFHNTLPATTDSPFWPLKAWSTEVEPSNRHVRQLIDEIKKEGVKAIFLESTLNQEGDQGHHPRNERENWRHALRRTASAPATPGQRTRGMMTDNVSTPSWTRWK